MNEETQAAAVAEETAAPGSEEQQGKTTTESAAGDSQEQTPNGEQKPKVTGGFQKRIDKLTREKEFWKEQALLRPNGQQQQTVQQTAAGTDEASKPKANDFETHAAYVEALADWKVDQRLKAASAEQARERAQSHQQSVQTVYQQKEQEFASAVPDFEEVVAGADFPVSPAVIEEIVHGDNGPALKYYLAQNPEEAERLNRMTPIQLAREVGRLEPKFKTAASSQKTTATISKAPAPPTPAAKSSATSSKDPGEMSPGEYREWRRKTFPNLR